MPEIRHPEGSGRPYREALPELALITFSFVCLFLTRVCVGPMLVPIETELQASHTQSGSFVFMIGFGAMLTMLGCGFVSGRIGHRANVSLALCVTGLGAFAAANAGNVSSFMTALFCIGLGAGLYISSAVGIITHITRQSDWGKALATHEMAPSLGFILGPVLAETALAMGGWRLAYLGMGCLLLSASALFLFRGPGKGLGGAAPDPAQLREVLRTPAFWIMASLFGLAVGTTLGPYTMLPLALVHEHGFSRAEANQLLALSRISGVFMAFAAGWLTDRLGARRTILLYLCFAGTFTAGLGLTTGSALVALVLAQPLVAGCFFPAGFTAISRLFPWRTRNMALSLITPVGAIVGSGFVPVAMGWLGDHVGFAAGFIVLGGLLLSLLPLARRLPGETPEGGGAS